MTNDFFTSSFKCAAGHSCVSVRLNEDIVEVADSKNPEQESLKFTKAEWAAFVKGVQNQEFNFPQ